jgi:CubicO group peptidase (beta-lactamase class C family)
MDRLAYLKTLMALACFGGMLVLGIEAGNAKIVEDIVDLPVRVAKADGQAVNHSIKLTIFRDDSIRGRLPFLILNHGRAVLESDRIKLGRARYSDNARYFVSKGFAVFVPTRVGYGISAGPDLEDTGPCRTKNYPPAYDAAVQQTVAAIEYAKTLPYVDPARGLVVGQSFGGATAIAAASKNIPGVMAAVNFAGGGGGNPETQPERPCRDDLLKALFASYGATARIPTLWLYSENDRYFGKVLPHAWFRAFTERGGSGSFVQLPAFKTDGHGSFTSNPPAWRPSFEEFITSCCRQSHDLAVAPVAPPASLSETPEAFTQVLAAWAVRHKVKQAVALVRREGRIVHRAAIGGGDPEAAYLLASLSKPVTGACTATLIRDGRLELETPLAKALALFFKANGKPADPRAARVTLAQLLSHRAGFSSADDGDDSATGTNLSSYLARHSPRDTPAPAYLTSVFKMKLARDPGKQFAYSNAGYLVLGAVIEEASGRPYEDYCRAAVLKPAGAAGELDSRWRVLSSMGGWRMNGADYLAFFDQFDPARATLGKKTTDWMLDKAGKTYGKTSYPSWYGPGIRLRDAGRGIEIWHTGSWRRQMPPDNQGPLSAETSTFAMRMADGTSWFVHSIPPVLGEARVELDAELLRAYGAVRSWK